MCMRAVTRKNKDGFVVRSLQLPHNEWDSAAGCAKAKVLCNFGPRRQLGERWKNHGSQENRQELTRAAVNFLQQVVRGGLLSVRPVGASQSSFASIVYDQVIPADEPVRVWRQILDGTIREADFASLYADSQRGRLESSRSASRYRSGTTTKGGLVSPARVREGSGDLKKGLGTDGDLLPLSQGALGAPENHERGGIALCGVALADGCRQAIQESGAGNCGNLEDADGS